MLKPENWENTPVRENIPMLPAGGYVIEIKDVEETVSKAGNIMLKIRYDIASGKYQGYFQKLWNQSDIDEDERYWQGTFYVLLKNDKNNVHWQYKQLITYIEDDNDILTDWNEDYNQYVGCKLGAIIRHEQHLYEGEVYESPKLYKLERIKNIPAVKPPRTKMLGESKAIVEDDDDLPF